MKTEITTVSNELSNLQAQFGVLSNGISTVSAQISTNFVSLSQVVATAFTEMTEGLTTFTTQFIAMQSFGDLGIVSSLDAINTTLLETKSILSELWDVKPISDWTDGLNVAANGVEILAGVIEMLKFATHEEELGMIAITIAVWAQHARNHGRQFNAQTWEESLPASVYGLEKYLGSGLIKGIGPKFAKRLCAQRRGCVPVHQEFAGRRDGHG
jgi:uncharacterized membrane protein